MNFASDFQDAAVADQREAFGEDAVWYPQEGGQLSITVIRTGRRATRRRQEQFHKLRNREVMLMVPKPSSEGATDGVLNPDRGCRLAFDGKQWDVVEVIDETAHDFTIQFQSAALKGSGTRDSGL